MTTTVIKVLLGGQAPITLSVPDINVVRNLTVPDINVVKVSGVVGGSGGAVDSVNNQTGVVLLDTDDIPEGSNEYYRDTKVDARISSASINDLSDVNAPNLNAGDVLEYTNGRWESSGKVSAIYERLKSDTGTQLYNTSNDKDRSYVDLQSTEGKLGLKQTFIKSSQASPGLIEFSVGCGAEGSEVQRYFKGRRSDDVGDLRGSRDDHCLLRLFVYRCEFQPIRDCREGNPSCRTRCEEEPVGNDNYHCRAGFGDCIRWS